MDARIATRSPGSHLVSDLEEWGDAGTDDGLRHALHDFTSAGWDSPVGRAILGALAARSVPWARSTATRRRLPAGAVDPVDVLAVAWFTLDRHATAVAGTARPWTYLWVCVSHALAIDAAAEAMLSERAPRRRAIEHPRRVIRIGLDDPILEVRDHTAESGGPGQSASVAALVALLATDGDVEFWAAAVGRAIDVMAGSRRSYEEYMLRRDPYLRSELGFTPGELSALGALLIGPRRGDRASQSLLLALHRDPTTPPGDVVGALARIAVLHNRTRRSRPTQCTRAA